MPQPKPLAWDDFRLVKTIAQARSLGGAAADLNVNHSTVFRRLGQIEKELGFRLFERHRAGYALTPGGEEMVSLAERIDTDIGDFVRRVTGCEPDPSGELRITTNDSLLTDLLTPLLAAFRLRYPDIRLDVVLTNQSLNLSKRDADVAIRATDSPPETLVGRRVATLHWALYGRAIDFPGGAPKDASQLTERNWVSLSDDLGSLKVTRFARTHIPPEKIALKINTVLGLAEAVAAGIGIGHLPCYMAGLRPGLVRLAAPEPDFAADLWLLTHPDLRHSARVRALLDFLAGELSTIRPRIEAAGTLAKPVAGAAQQRGLRSKATPA
ncbi:MAG TPA: LysR family transcriptional regulator [Xanthobacteraceae bacterium]|nr:LysR family transcriptional regulator [Xanthobacteraceae bacterium]